MKLIHALKHWLIELISLMLAAVLLFASSKCWVHRNWFRCRLDAAFTKLCVDFGVRLVPTPLTPAASDFLHNSFTMLHISHCGAGGNFADLRPQRAKGHLGSLLGFESLHPVYDYEPAALSQHHTRLYEFAEAVSQCSEPSWHWCVLAVFHCYIRSHRSIPMLFNALHDVRHTCKWLWHLNSDAVTGIINIHMKSFPGQFLALAYIVFPVFPDHLEIDSTNWTITVASLTQLMLSQSWANHISISRWKLDVWNRTVVYLMRSQL